ncbi:MAG: carbon monoxide dehydrogenase [Desulfobacterales bacterium CG23_combo_of_CG06-09_8_20_14_all_52_9]|nr:MAG: carbon monoxide dehydrogenase [Desulfobacterales bacterium CG23_combo_of_CG06-09_8_20_14_all_52_9]
MRRFAYMVPKSLDEAVSMYVSRGERARYIAGGTDILLKIKEKKIFPDYLISLKHILCPDRPLFNPENGELYIGAFVTHRRIETSKTVQVRYPILHDAVKNIGSVQIRNVATIGGNLVNAVPSADGAVPLIALDARVNIHGPKGERSMDLLRFFLGPGQCDLETGEILTEIIVPPLLPRTGSAYLKFGRREAMELPLLGVGVVLSLREDLRTCVKARIALGVAAPTPMRAIEAEAFLAGKPINEMTLEEAGKIAARESKVRDSIRGVAWYRREMVGVLVKRMGQKALERIQETESRR